LSHNDAQNPLHTFPRNFPVDGEVTGKRVSDTADKSATSWQQVIVGLMEFGKRHYTTNTTDRVILLRICNGETGVMDFGLDGALLGHILPHRGMGGRRRREHPSRPATAARRRVASATARRAAACTDLKLTCVVNRQLHIKSAPIDLFWLLS